MKLTIEYDYDENHSEKVSIEFQPSHYRAVNAYRMLLTLAGFMPYEIDLALQAIVKQMPKPLNKKKK